jgi:hypothetical protein
MRASIALNLAFLLCSLESGKAEEPSRCWEIISAVNVPPYSSVLLDKCSGKTWFVVKQRVAGSKPPSIVYRWAPLLTNDATDEPGFLENPPIQTPQLEGPK